MVFETGKWPPRERQAASIVCLAVFGVFVRVVIGQDDLHRMRLDLGRRPEGPRRQQSVFLDGLAGKRTAMLAGEIEVDRQRLLHHELVILDRRDQRHRVDGKEGRRVGVERRVGRQRIGQPPRLDHRHGLEVNAEFLRHPVVARGA